MFSKKSRSNSTLSPNNSTIETPPLPKLQQLTTLETELISIIGKKNITLNEDNDIFTRLEELYINNLQNSRLGIQMLEKCIKIVGDIDAPVRVRFLYFYAHEMKLGGETSDKIEIQLLNSFWSNLNLKNKVDLGFKSGLIYCQMSLHSCEIDKIINNLIVGLEQQVGFRGREKTKIKSQSINKKHGIDAMKNIYIGSRISHKSTHKSNQNGNNKFVRLNLFKLLYQVYLTAILKIKSEAKKKYYSECLEQLRGKLIRQYPGINIQTKLNIIQTTRTKSFKQFSQPVQNPNHKETTNYSSTTPNSFNRKSHSKNQSKTSTQFQTCISNTQSLMNSFVKEKQGRSTTPLNSKMSSTHGRSNKMKLMLKDRSKTKLQAKMTSKQQTEREESTRMNQMKVQLSKLVFRDKMCESNKGLILNFQKLHETGKACIKKKKLKANINWYEKQSYQSKQQKQNIQPLPYLSRINQHPSQQITNQTALQINQDNIQKYVEEHSHDMSIPSVIQLGSDLNSVRKIDQIIKDGLDWILNQDKKQQLHQVREQFRTSNRFDMPYADISYEQPQIPNYNQKVNDKLQDYQDSFSETYHINTDRELDQIDQVRQSQNSEKAEYKIIIMGQSQMENTDLHHQAAQISNQLQKSQDLGQEKRENGTKYDDCGEIIREEIQKMVAEINQYIIQQQVQKKQIKNKSTLFMSIQVNFSANTQKQQQINNKQDYIDQCQIEEEQQMVEICSNFQKTESITEQQQKAQSSQPPQIDQIQTQKQHQLDPEIIKEFLQQIYKQIISHFSLANLKEQQTQQIQCFFIRLYINIIQSCSNTEFKSKFSLIKEEDYNEDDQNSIECVLTHQDPIHSQGEEYDDQNLDSEIQSVPSRIQIPALIEQNNRMTEDSSSLNILKEFITGRPKTKNQEEIRQNKQIQSNLQTLNNQPINDLLFEDSEIKVSPRVQQLQKLKQIKKVRLSQDNQYMDDSVLDENGTVEGPNRIRSRSDGSDNSNNYGGMSTNRSGKRQQTHLSISIHYNQNFDAMTEYNKKLQHWLNPELLVSHNFIIFSIQHPQIDKIHEKKIAMDGIKIVKDEEFKKMEDKIMHFLNGFKESDYVNMSEQVWNKIVQEVDGLDILPDQIQFKAIDVYDAQNKKYYEVKLMHRVKTNSLVVECESRKFKCHTIDIPQNQNLQTLSELINEQNTIIIAQQLFFIDIWVLLGQRNIKFKDRYQNIALHYSFNVYEMCKGQDTFQYTYRVANVGEQMSMQFSGINQELRKKIWSNIDTIIGFCLKQVGKKQVVFNSSDIHNFLKLL